jgi:hypothetical protein
MVSLPAPSAPGFVHRVADLFESAWKTGEQPRIEDYLGDCVEPQRARLLRRLLELDIRYRRGCGDSTSLREYEDRFPVHADIVRQVYCNAESLSGFHPLPRDDGLQGGR